jgi:hypothetical protein
MIRNAYKMFTNPNGNRLLRRPQKKQHDNTAAHSIMNLWGTLPWGFFCTDHLSNYYLLKKELGCIELLYEMLTSYYNVRIL